jgi:heme oxygenase
MTTHEKLKTETKELHDKSENHQFYKELLSNKLAAQRYFVYLHNIFPVVSYVERRLGLTGEMVRSPLLHNDIMQYSKSGCTLTGKDLFYFDWIDEISKKDDIYLLALLYVEWLKDVFGGQVIAKNLKFKSTYNFNNPKSVIDFVMNQIHSLPEDQADKLIQEVNRIYENHIKLIDEIIK